MKRKKLIAMGLIASMVTPYCNLTAYARVSSSEEDVEYNKDEITSDGKYTTTVKVSKAYSYTMKIPKHDHDFIDVCEQAKDDYYAVMPMDEDTDTMEAVDAIQEMANILETYKTNLSEDSQDLLESLLDKFEDNGILTNEEFKQLRDLLEELERKTASKEGYDEAMVDRVEILEGIIDSTIIDQAKTNDNLDDAIYESLDVISLETLSDEDQAKYKELKEAYEANGGLNNVELAELVDLLHAVLKNHMDSNDFDEHLKDDLQDIIDNYDKIDDDVAKELIKDIVDDLKDSDNLDYKDKEALDNIEKELEDGEKPTKKELSDLLDTLDEKTSRDDEDYDKVVSKDIEEVIQELMDILDGKITDDDEIASIIQNGLNIADFNKDDLSDEEKKVLDDLLDSFDKDRKLTDRETVDLIDVLEAILNDHVSKDDYDQYVKDKLDEVIDNYKDLSDDAKKELVDDIIEDVKDFKDLDYKDEIAIKDIEDTLDKDKTPTENQLETLRDNLKETLDTSGDNYDKLVSKDIEEIIQELMDILDGKITDKDEIANIIQNGLDLAEYNKDDLTNEEKEVLDKLLSSFDENGKLTNTEIVDLIDMLEAILDNHVSKDDYDQYVKDKLDEIIENYDKLPDDVKKEIVDDLIDDVKNIDNLDYKDEIAIKDIEDTLDKDKTPDKGQLETLRDNLKEDLDTSGSNYDKLVSKDIEEIIQELMDILDGTITDEGEIARIIKDGLNIAEYNKDDLTKEEQEILDKLLSSFDKDGKLTDKEIVDLIDVLEAILDDHVSKDDYEDYVKDKLNDIIDKYDDLSDDAKKELADDLIEDVKNIDNLDYKDEIAIKDIEDTLDKGETPDKDQLETLRDNLKEDLDTSGSNYDKLVSKDIKEIIEELMDILDGTITNEDDIARIIKDGLNIAEYNKDDLTKEEQEILDKLLSSFDKDGKLTDNEIVDLIDVLEAILDNHVSKDDYEDYVKDKLNDIIDKYDDLSDDAKKELVDDLDKDVNNFDDLDYRDKIAIKDIEDTLDKGETPSKDQLETLKDCLNDTIDDTGESYDKLVSGDVKEDQEKLLKILTKETTNADEIAKEEKNAMDLVDYNKDDLSKEEQAKLEELQASFDKNGKLTESEVVELMDLLDSVLEDHVTKKEYDEYAKTKLDELINNYDKLSDTSKQGLSDVLMDDLANIDDVNYKALLEINNVENIVANGKTPTKENLEAVKTALNATLTEKEYNAQVGKDVEGNASELLKILSKETTNANDIEKTIKDSFAIADANTKDLTDAQKKALSDLEAAYEKNGTLTETQIVQLMDILDAVLEDHVSKEEYDKFVEQRLSDVIDKYDKLSDTSKKELSKILMEDLENLDDLNYKAKLAINDVNEMLDNNKVPTKASLTAIKDALNADTTSSSYDEQLATDVKASQSDLMKILTKETTATKDIAKSEQTALDIADYNRGSLSDSEKTTLNNLQTSFEKNGKLTESEIVSLMDILDSVLYNHVTKSEYDTYAKTKLDDLISKYDKLSDVAVKGLSNTLMSDLNNIDNINYKAKQEIMVVEKALNNNTKPTKEQLVAIRDAMNATLNETNYNKQVVEDIKDSQNDIFDIFTGNITNKDDISDIIENALNILKDNKDDLTSSEQKTLDKLISSFAKNGTLTNSELADLFDLLNACMQKHMSEEDYLKYLLELTNKIYNNYDKLPSKVRNDLSLSIVNDLLGFESRLSTENKNTLNLLKISLTLGIDITKDQVQEVSRIINDMLGYTQTTTTSTTTSSDNNGTKNNVQTGDNSPILILTGLILASVAGMLEFVFKKKRK